MASNLGKHWWWFASLCFPLWVLSALSALLCNWMSASCGWLPRGSLACWPLVYGATESGDASRKSKSAWKRERPEYFLFSAPIYEGTASLVDLSHHPHSYWIPCWVPQQPLQASALTGHPSCSPVPLDPRLKDGISFLLLLVPWYLNIPCFFPYTAHTSASSLSFFFFTNIS